MNNVDKRAKKKRVRPGDLFTFSASPAFLVVSNDGCIVTALSFNGTLVEYNEHFLVNFRTLR